MKRMLSVMVMLVAQYVMAAPEIMVIDDTSRTQMNGRITLNNPSNIMHGSNIAEISNKANQAIAAATSNVLRTVAGWTYVDSGAVLTDQVGRIAWSSAYWPTSTPLHSAGGWTGGGTGTVDILQRGLVAATWTTVGTWTITADVWTGITISASLPASNVLGARVQAGVTATSMTFGVRGWLP